LELCNSKSWFSDSDLVRYRCIQCGHESGWLFDAPAPILVEGRRQIQKSPRAIPVLLALLLSTPAWGLCSSARDYVFRGTVTRVLDGDTIAVKLFVLPQMRYELKVRLYGIDAPELTAKDDKERAKAVAATEYLAMRLFGTAEVFVRVDRFDSFGRGLGDVWVGQECINDTLVHAGFAKPY
jgi:endonuclease YncB( thermonuclease family)